MAIGALHGESDRHATAFGEHAALGADLAAVGGILAHLFPPKGGFGHRAVHRQPRPVNPPQGVIVQQALSPEGKEDVRLRPLLEAAMGGTTGTEARFVQRIPLAAGAEHEEDGIHGLPIIDTGTMTPQGVRFARREQRLDALPQLVGIRQSRCAFSWSSSMRVAPVRETVSLQDTIKTAYWDSL